MRINSILYNLLLESKTQMYLVQNEIQFKVIIPFERLEKFKEALAGTEFDVNEIQTFEGQNYIPIQLREIFEVNEYRLKDYKNCFSEEEFYCYADQISEFEREIKFEPTYMNTIKDWKKSKKEKLEEHAERILKELGLEANPPLILYGAEALHFLICMGVFTDENDKKIKKTNGYFYCEKMPIGYGKYKKTGVVCILKPKVATLAHELRHAYQYKHNRDIMKMPEDVYLSVYFYHPNEQDADKYALAYTKKNSKIQWMIHSFFFFCKRLENDGNKPMIWWVIYGIVITFVMLFLIIGKINS